MGNAPAVIEFAEK